MPFPKPQKGYTIPIGTYIARCISVAYMGTVENTFGGRVTHAPTILLGFELPALMREFEGVESPATISYTGTYSISSNSNYYKFMIGWAGKNLTDKELENIEPTALVNGTCLLVVGHSSSGRAKIDAILPNKDVATGQPYEVPPMMNVPVRYNVMEHNQAEFDKLWDWVKEDIMTSPEYIAAVGAAPPAAAAAPFTPPGATPFPQTPQNAQPAAPVAPGAGIVDPLATLQPASQIPQPAPKPQVQTEPAPVPAQAEVPPQPQPPAPDPAATVSSFLGGGTTDEDDQNLPF